MEKVIKVSLLFSVVILVSFCGQGFKQEKRQLQINKFYIKEVGFSEFDLDSLDVDLNKLVVVDSSDSAFKSMRRNSTSAQYFYYSILDTNSNVQSLVYLFSNEGKELCLELINFDKNGGLISTAPLFCAGGEMEDYYTIETEFNSKNNILSQKIVEGYFDETDSLVVTDKLNLKLRLNEDGSITRDTIR